MEYLSLQVSRKAFHASQFETLQGRQAGALEVDGLPNEPDCLVHFRARVGGLRALSNPSVNNSSTERQLMEF